VAFRHSLSNFGVVTLEIVFFFNTVARCVNAVRTNDKKSHATNFHSDPATNQRAPAQLIKKNGVR
jgi:hypothetical protein